MGLRPKSRGDFAARMLLGTRPQTPAGAPPQTPAGAPPQTPLGLPFSRGSRAQPKRGSGGGAPSYILAANPPRGLGRSPIRRGPPGPPLATPLGGGGGGGGGRFLLRLGFGPGLEVALKKSEQRRPAPPPANMK